MSTDNQISNSNDSPTLVVSKAQIDEVRKRKKYYASHPDELIRWDDVQKLIEKSIL